MQTILPSLPFLFLFCVFNFSNQLIDCETTFLPWNNSLVDLRLRLIIIVHESTNQGNPSDGNLSPFPSFGNIGAHYIATLSLLVFTIGFIVWFSSTSLVLSVQTTSQPSSHPLEQNQPQIDPKLDPLPSLPIVSSSLPSSSPGESLDSSNQESKKNKKKNI